MGCDAERGAEILFRRLFCTASVTKPKPPADLKNKHRFAVVPVQFDESCKMLESSTVESRRMEEECGYCRPSYRVTNTRGTGCILVLMGKQCGPGMYWSGETGELRARGSNRLRFPLPLSLSLYLCREFP